MNLKIKKIIVFLIFTSLLFSCNKNNVYIALYNEEEYQINDYNLFDDSYIIFPKCQIEAQNLSVIIKNNNDELIIFDGGRVEDAKYLSNIIIENGGKVKAWYLSHIHDDHIGAIISILQEKKYDFQIENIIYNFADFNWYYEKIGNDAGICNLFYDALKNYNDLTNDKKINIIDNIDNTSSFIYGNVKIDVMNNLYLLDSDSINNTSMIYKVSIDDISMIVLGDLGYEGGFKLIEDNKNLKADICVLSHHGQNGVSKEVYEKIEPKIAIWPTSKNIYENVNKKYDTDNTKKWLNDLKVKNNIVTYEYTQILK